MKPGELVPQEGSPRLLPLQVPPLPAPLEATASALVHASLGLPALLALLHPALQLQLFMVRRALFGAAEGLALLVGASAPARGYWRGSLGFLWGYLDELAVLILLFPLAALLALPLQAGARRRALVAPETLPTYAAVSGLAVAGAWWGLGLGAALTFAHRFYTPAWAYLSLGAVLGLLVAARVRRAGRHAGLQTSDLRASVASLAGGALEGGLVTLAVLGILAARLLAYPPGPLPSLRWLLLGLPAAAVLIFLVLVRPLRQLLGSPRPAPPALPPGNLPASSS